MSQSFSFDPATGQRGAGFPAPGANAPGGGLPRQPAWTPGNVSDDPHDMPFEVGGGPPMVGDVPSNIIRAADFGDDDGDGDGFTGDADDGGFGDVDSSDDADDDG